MTHSMERQKILDRIKKLLSLSEDNNSPEESFVAAKQARKLMDKHQVSKEEASNYIDESKADFGECLVGKAYQRRPLWVGTLSAAMAKLNDCLSNVSEGKTNFMGFKADIVIARYLYQYLFKETRRQAQQVEGRLRNSFCLGFALGVKEQVRILMKERDKLKINSSTALVRVKTDAVKKHFGDWEPKTVKSTRSVDLQHQQAAQVGYQSGLKVSLNKQVSSKDKVMELS